MASRKAKNGIEYVGKIGGVILSNWKGKAYLKAVPAGYTDRKSASQLTQRSKMSLSHNFVKRVLPAAHVGYGHLAAEKSAYNLCMSQVMRSAVMGEHPNVWLDYERVLLGQGPLSVADGVVISQQGCAARVSWRTDIVVGCGDVDDRALLTVYNVNRGVAQFWFRRSLRLDGNCDILFPNEWRGDEVVCYLGFENKEETLCSNMVYVGRCSPL